MELIVFYACFVASLIFCLRKWEFDTLYQQYRKKWMPDWCDFCLGFWLNFLFNSYSNGLTSINAWDITIYLPFFALAKAFAGAAITKLIID